MKKNLNKWLQDISRVFSKPKIPSKSQAPEHTQHTYLDRLVEHKDFVENLVPLVFEGVKSSTVFFANRRFDLASVNRFYVFGPNGTVWNKELEISQFAFLCEVERIANTGSNFLFINVGNDDVNKGIAVGLRGLKKIRPDLKIIVFCSNYFDKNKEIAIRHLIDDEIIEKYTVYDLSFIENDQRLVLVEAIARAIKK